MQASIPQPVSTDPEDVHWALTTAHSLHAQGDYEEALRWLRRAVAAAAAGRDDHRASELGRHVASLEASLSAAATERRAAAAALASYTLDLDCPTHVDTKGEPSAIMAEDTQSDGGGQPSDEITLVPYTMKAAEQRERHTPIPRATRPQTADTARTLDVGQTMEVAQFPVRTQALPGVPSFVDEAEESTQAMRVAPNAHEIGDVDSHPHAPHSDAHQLEGPRAPGLGPLSGHRVALLASPDGHDPRVMALKRGDSAPAGAGIAVLIPVTGNDAARIRLLLGLDRE